MRVSVIVPTYQRRKYLPQALSSCAHQTMKGAQFEVILVNDGGAGLDAERARAMFRATKCAASFHYLRIAHAGLSAAINAGVARARGQYYTVLPDDDMMLPTQLLTMADFLDESPKADVAYALPRYIDGNGKEIPAPSPWPLRQFLRKHRTLAWKHIERGDGLRIHGVGLLYRREAIAPSGGWDEKLPTAEEFEFHLRLLHAGHTFHGIDQVLTCYRRHDANKSTEFRKTKRAEWMPYIYGKFFKDAKAPHA